MCNYVFRINNKTATHQKSINTELISILLMYLLFAGAL